VHRTVKYKDRKAEQWLAGLAWSYCLIGTVLLWNDKKILGIMAMFVQEWEGS
jgi:hypothetical protein